ncbi:MAG TPA: hypothetical protein VGI45_34710 [Terracidiphilus sp.]|jgi:hypothetical protein
MPEGNSDDIYAGLSKRGTTWKSPLGTLVAVGIFLSLVFCAYFFINRFYTSKTELQTMVALVQKDVTAINK